MVCDAGEFAGFALRLAPLARGRVEQSGRRSVAGTGRLGAPPRECGGRFRAGDAGIPTPGATRQSAGVGE